MKLLEIPFSEAAFHVCDHEAQVLESKSCRETPVTRLAVADDFSVLVLLEFRRAPDEFVQRDVVGAFNMLLVPFFLSADVQEKRSMIVPEFLVNLRRSIRGHRSRAQHPAYVEEAQDGKEGIGDDLSVHRDSISLVQPAGAAAASASHFARRRG